MAFRASPVWRVEVITVSTHESIITIEPGKRGGQPCIRGLRMTVYDVLSYLASGMAIDDVLADFPYLTREDVHACLSYAAATRSVPRSAVPE